MKDETGDNSERLHLVIPEPVALAVVMPCKCMKINLPQGIAILPSKECEPGLLLAVNHHEPKHERGTDE